MAMLALRVVQVVTSSSVMIVYVFALVFICFCMILRARVCVSFALCYFWMKVV
jgi:hypothetical protein